MVPFLQVTSTDPCTSGNDPCKNGATCSYNESQKTYSCICPSEMFSGKNCQIDECKRRNCPLNSQCAQESGKVGCKCLPGFKGMP